LRNDVEHESLCGDYEELYALVCEEQGEQAARRMVRRQIISTLPVFMINTISWSITMWMFNLRQFWRTMRRRKVLSLINITGLAIGMACSMLILFWLSHQLSFDSFHARADRIYRVAVDIPDAGEMEISPAPLADAVARELPEVAAAVRIATHFQKVFRYNDLVYYENNGIIADPAFFDVFSFPFKKGDPHGALRDPYHLVITDSFAKKYFGEEDPMGKVMEMDGQSVTVVGVLEDIPANSHLVFDFVSSFEFIDVLSNFGTKWGMFNFVTYLELNEGAVATGLGKKITEIARRHHCPQVVMEGGWRFLLQPLSTVHLGSRIQMSWLNITEVRYVYIFCLIALSVLLIACINFLNLTTAQFINRTPEVGLLKSIGANRTQLSWKFLQESTMMVILSFLVALVLMALVWPSFQRLTGQSRAFSLWSAELPLVAVSIIAATLFLAGIYPALLFSSFCPVKTIRGRFRHGRRGQLLRKIQVTFQFCVSGVLILGSLAIYRQLEFMQTTDLGFNPEGVVYVPLKENLAREFGTFRTMILQNPAVQKVSAQSYLLATMTNRTDGYDWEGRPQGMRVDMILNRVETDFLDTMGLKLVAGRDFSARRSSDRTTSFILNQEAARRMGVVSPVGKKFSLGDRRGTIIGIIHDAKFRSMHVPIEPHVFWLTDDLTECTDLGVALIRLIPGQEKQGVAAVQAAWNKINPGLPFEYH